VGEAVQVATAVFVLAVDHDEIRDALGFKRLNESVRCGSRLRIGRLVDPVGPAAEFSRRDHERPTREKKTAQNGKYIPGHLPGQGKVCESGRSRDNRVYP
jgi:hypothetical protein